MCNNDAVAFYNVSRDGVNIVVKPLCFECKNKISAVAIVTQGSRITFLDEITCVGTENYE